MEWLSESAWSLAEHIVVVVCSVIGAVGGATSWILRRAFVSQAAQREIVGEIREQISGLEAKFSEYERSQARISLVLDQMPTGDAITDLKVALTRLDGHIATHTELIRRLERESNRMTDGHLKGGRP